MRSHLLNQMLVLKSLELKTKSRRLMLELRIQSYYLVLQKLMMMMMMMMELKMQNHQ